MSFCSYNNNYKLEQFPGADETDTRIRKVLCKESLANIRHIIKWQPLGPKCTTKNKATIEAG